MPKPDLKRRPYDTLKGIADRLAMARHVLGLSQADACRALGIKPNTWSMWETGKNLPDPLIMANFCDKYALTLDYVYRGRTAGIADERMREALEALSRWVEQRPKIPHVP